MVLARTIFEANETLKFLINLFLSEIVIDKITDLLGSFINPRNPTNESASYVMRYQKLEVNSSISVYTGFNNAHH